MAETNQKPEGVLKLYSTQIPNILLDRLMPVVAPALWKIVCCVARQTYGWQKKWDAISVTQAIEKTGLSNRCVIDGFADLVDAGVLVLGEVGKYGQEYSLNSSCDMDKACDVLKPKERQPRRKTGGSPRKDEANNAGEQSSYAGEPSSLADEGIEVNPVHQLASEPSSPEVVNHDRNGGEAGSAPLVNPVHPQKKLSNETIKTNYQKGERPPSPSMMIAREKLALYIRRNGPDSYDPEYDKKLFSCILAGRGGLTPTQAKEFLAEDPEWRKWKYLAVLDSQQEINFPEPEKPKPVGSIDYPPDFTSDGLLWVNTLTKLTEKVSRHSFDTWLKPTHAFGIRRRILYVCVPSSEFRQIGDKFGDLIQEAIGERADDVKFLTQQDMAAQQWEASA
jgi:hypothetical protein